MNMAFVITKQVFKTLNKAQDLRRTDYTVSFSVIIIKLPQNVILCFVEE